MLPPARKSDRGGHAFQDFRHILGGNVKEPIPETSQLRSDRFSLCSAQQPPFRFKCVSCNIPHHNVIYICLRVVVDCTNRWNWDVSESTDEKHVFALNEVDPVPILDEMGQLCDRHTRTEYFRNWQCLIFLKL